MKKKITFAIISNSGCKIKKITASPKAIRIASLLAVGSLVFIFAIMVNYYNLKNIASDTKILRRIVALQNEEIQHHKNQVKTFAAEINSLKTKLVKLNNLEKKIRIIANMENDDNNSSIFGIGGSAPGDIPIIEEHTTILREMHEQSKILNIASSRQQDGLVNLLGQLENKVDLLASTPSIHPVNGWITSKFGYRHSPFTNQREFHQGFDIGAPKGTKVIATADGIITFAGTKGTLGRTVIIDHGHGMVTRYGHLYKILKQSGKHVKRGEVIARIGSSGRSTGYHLHYEIRINGIPVNPEKYLDMTLAKFVTSHKRS